MKRPKVSRQEHKGSTTVMQEIADHSETENLLVSLKQLTFKLFREVESLSQVPTLNTVNGVDFYDEVTRFEIDLINRALLFTGGHQTRAARLLNLNVTTLSSMIKHYNISLEVFTCDKQQLNNRKAVALKDGSCWLTVEIRRGARDQEIAGAIGGCRNAD